MSLIFDETQYTVKTLEEDGQKLVYRAFEGIPYVSSPTSPELQQLSIFVPEAFYEGKSINGYDLKTAPIFFPNTVGGYRPGPLLQPGRTNKGIINAAFYALLHGYVVVSAGARGRGMQDASGKYIGCAPSVICDLKAAVRYLRFNIERIPGDTDKIITNGTSAGGASSSLLGCTGNHPDYEELLSQMGAAPAGDHVFASSCYCPITNLDHADMAYEWEFNGLNDYVRWTPDGTADTRRMTDEQQALSDQLKVLFPAYVNSLNLRDIHTHPLTLDDNGNGSFKEYVKEYVIASCNNALQKGTDLSCHTWITMDGGQVTDVDFHRYIAFRTRMKTTPAFDNVGMGTAENELFGSPDTFERHFTGFGLANSTVNGTLAEAQQIKMMNPMYYIDDPAAQKAQHFRIRHGAVDRDTSLAIPVILTTKLQNAGIDAELAFPWGIPHAGDYDLEELFAWIDSIC